MRAAVLGRDVDRLLEQPARVPVRVLGELENEVLAPHHEPIGAHVARMGRFLPPLGDVDVDRQARGDRPGDLVLQVEEFFEFEIEPVGPQHGFGGCVDEFDGDAKALVGPPQAAAENVTHAEAPLDFLCGIGAEIEQEGRVPRDHHQIAEPGEAGNDVFGDPLAEMIVTRIAGQIGQRQDRDGRMPDRLRRRTFTERPGEPYRLCARMLDLEHLDRLGDVLQVRLAERPQGRSGKLAHRGAERAADQNAARVGHGLKARRDIDAMSIGDRFVQRHLADVEADSELDRLAVAPNRLLAKFGLDLDGEAQRLPGAVEQSKNSIASDIGDTTAVIANQIPEQLNRTGDLIGAADFILLHPPAELDHVGDHHGGARSSPLRRRRRCRWFRGYHRPRPQPNRIPVDNSRITASSNVMSHGRP